MKKLFHYMLSVVLILCICLSLSCEEQVFADEPVIIKIGFYGIADYYADELIYKFNQLDPYFAIQATNYGQDESGFTRLMADLNSRDKLDLVVSEGYLLESSPIFTDLYPFIDGDDTLKREDFFGFILKGLEKNGSLYQIWSNFGLSSIVALGALTEGPVPLKLNDCTSYLESIGVDSILFDEYITREMLLGYLADGILQSAYNTDESRYQLDTAEVCSTLAFCRSLPVKFDFENITDPALTDLTVLSDNISLEYLKALEKQNVPYRLFDGSDGGDNFSYLAAYYHACYAIPASCKDKQTAWAFLRLLLMPDYQIAITKDGYHGYPINIEAFYSVAKSYLSDSALEKLLSSMERAIIIDFEKVQLRRLFTEGISSYLYGDYNLADALFVTQGKINIYFAEHVN